jgi:GTPase SAR1 family protein
MNPGLFEQEARVRREIFALGDVSWPSGETCLPGFKVGFAGPGGSGKSSMVRALLGQQADDFLASCNYHFRTTIPTEYRYGADFQLSARRTKDGTWVPIHSKGAPLDLTECLSQVGCSFDAASILLPLPILREWGVVLVDMPCVGSESHLDGLARNELAQCDAVVWVMDSRRWGLSDHEIEFLHALQFHPLMFILNIREDDLIPTAIPVEVKDVSFRGPMFPGVFPVISAMCYQDPSQERQLLLDMLSLLRKAQMEQDPRDILTKPSLLQTVEQLRVSIAETAECRLRAFQKMLDEGRPLDGIKALHGILTLQHHLMNQVPQSLANLREVQKELEKAIACNLNEEYRAAVIKAEELARDYNIRAGANTKNSFSDADQEGEQFGGAFTKPREELHQFIENALQDKDDLMLGEHDILALEMLDVEISDGRIEIALLGMFSSGKSALVNRLLGVQINDQNSELLPTKPTVTTATVNRLEWAETRQLNKVDWLEKSELNFLQNQPGVGIRVREQEIIAFEQWVKKGTVLLEECDIQEFESPKGGQPVKGEKLFENLVHAVRVGGKFPNYIVPLPGSRLAGRVRVTKFHGAKPGLIQGMPLSEAFPIAEKPEVSLQIQMMHIGTPHPLLKHGAIVDTPGTDSHIPHHRTLSRSLIKQRRIPIIYCFLSTQPGGIEDKSNLQVLLDAGAETMRRVFFVITRKGDIETDNREELRRHVRLKLDTMGMPVQGLHFIELLKFPDPEFKDFSNQISEFIKAEHGPQLCTWAARARDLLKQTGENAAKNLANFELEISDRIAKEADLKAKLEKVNRIYKELPLSQDWGAPYLRRRVKNEIERSCEKISDAIGMLQGREDFNGFATRLDNEEEDLNKSVNRAIHQVINAMQSKLKTELAEVKAGKLADYRFEEVDYFDLSAVVTLAKDVDFSALDAFWSGLTYKPQIDKVRSTISSSWSQARSKGLNACAEIIELSITYCQNEVGRSADSIKVELELVGLSDPLEQTRRQKQLGNAKERANDWVKRFKNWEEKYAKKV